MAWPSLRPSPPPTPASSSYGPRSSRSCGRWSPASRTDGPLQLVGQPGDALEQPVAQVDAQRDEQHVEVPRGPRPGRLLVVRAGDERAAFHAGAVRGDRIRVVEPVARLAPGHRT